MKYKAPISGYYLVSQDIAYCIPTGKMETVPNPNKKWWEFWKPATVTRPEFILEWKPDGSQVLYLKVGETVDSKIAIRRI